MCSSGLEYTYHGLKEYEMVSIDKDSLLETKRSISLIATTQEKSRGNHEENLATLKNIFEIRCYFIATFFEQPKV
jgi:hypothetical protein